MECGSSSIFALERTQQRFNASFQRRKVSFGSHPDLLGVNTEVIMNQDISHRYNLRPGYFRMGLMELAADSCGCLTDNLKVMDNPSLHEFTVIEFFSTARNIPFDSLDRLKNIPEFLSRVIHSGTASRMTLSRILGLIPRSLTTSTLHPRSS
ncbi:MAG: hypothetical protein GHCLOJNM_04420 [bacterium]|nr:hypothetical protein [bacterium]